MLSMVRYQGAQAQLRAPRSTFTAAMSAFGFVFRAPDMPGTSCQGMPCCRFAVGVPSAKDCFAPLNCGLRPDT